MFECRWLYVKMVHTSSRGKIAKRFDKVRILMVERFVPPRKQIHAAIRFDRDSAIAVEFDFLCGGPHKIS